MVEDGFTAKFVSMVLQEIEDHDLLDLNYRDESAAPDIGVFRSSEGPFAQLIAARPNEEPYYVLKLRELIRGVDTQILSDQKK